MPQLLSAVSFLINIYMMIIFVRIMLTWFSWTGGSGLLDVLARITDPYLNWFRRFPIFRMGNLDLSPVAALGILSLVNRIFNSLALYGHITVGIVLAMILQVAWGVVSFILGFLIIILILRLICHLAKQNSYGTFWRIVDSISQPVLFRINRILFKDRIVSYGTGLVISIVSLGIIYLVLRIIVTVLTGALVRLPF